MDSPIQIVIPRMGKTEHELFIELRDCLATRDGWQGARVTDDAIILDLAPDPIPAQDAA